MNLSFSQLGATRAQNLQGGGGVALAMLILLFLLGQAHEVLAPFAPGAAGTGPALTPPSLLHPLGTDVLGRDLWSETLHGLGSTAGAAAIGLIVTLFAGHLAGLVAGHLLGRAGFALRIGANVLVSLPALLLAILFSALLQPGSAAFAAGLAVAPAAFLHSYGRVRAVLSAPYSDFARASGVTNMALFKRDLMHELRDIVATMARSLAAVTMIFSTMSFFGFGARPPLRDLGLMIASARADLPEVWWTSIVPAATLILFILTARLAAGIAGDERA